MKNIIFITIIISFFIKNQVAIAQFFPLESQINPQFKVFYQEESSHGLLNKIEIINNQDKVIIDISSEHGIGTGTIKIIEGNWPEKAIVRLHLQGLEGFTVSNGEIAMNLSDLEIKAYDANNNLIDNKYLLNGGYYEIELPDCLFLNEITEIKINWIDFYRI